MRGFPRWLGARSEAEHLAAVRAIEFPLERAPGSSYEPAKDAWKQHDELLGKFTKMWTPRTDLRVTARACERDVRFSLRYYEGDGTRLELSRWHSTTRNVGTMRELAEAILAACDFVDESNPVWAARG